MSRYKNEEVEKVTVKAAFCSGGSGGGIPGAPLTPSNSQPQVGIVLQLQVILLCALAKGAD